MNNKQPYPFEPEGTSQGEDDSDRIEESRLSKCEENREH